MPQAEQTSDEASRKARLVAILQEASGSPIVQVGGRRSSHFRSRHGWPFLVKYACGHERVNATTFFVGVPLDTERRTVIAIAFGDSDEDVFLPAPVLIDRGEHVSSDGTAWKPYIFRDPAGELWFRITPLHEDLRLGAFHSAEDALSSVGFTT